MHNRLRKASRTAPRSNGFAPSPAIHHPKRRRGHGAAAAKTVAAMLVVASMLACAVYHSNTDAGGGQSQTDALVDDRAQRNFGQWLLRWIPDRRIPATPTSRDGPNDDKLHAMNAAIVHNADASQPTWVLNPDLLPYLHNDPSDPTHRFTNALLAPRGRHRSKISWHGVYFRISRRAQLRSGGGFLQDSDAGMDWERECDELMTRHGIAADSDLPGPKMDYTGARHYAYTYPRVDVDVAASKQRALDGAYPPLRPLHEIMNDWPQDEIDAPPLPIREDLQHFDFQDKQQLELATWYRDEAKLPFKLTNVPDLQEAGFKWTDHYLTQQFDSLGARTSEGTPTTSGKCQESRNNFFVFFQANLWDVDTMGIPPTRNNDWTFRRWSRHSRYADATGLHPEQPHFYWQSGVPAGERHAPSQDAWTFVSRDLPLLSSPDPTFVSPRPDEQKGIQCRFGERGVTAAIHYDGGQNMVAMIHGAKRYVLAPPNQCSKFGIVTTHDHALFRHSILNLGHLKDEVLRHADMPEQEREWLRHSAGHAQAVETVLKAGEVLFIPSHWFHYIISLQKNAQCNVRSGVYADGSTTFGGQRDILADSCDKLAS